MELSAKRRRDSKKWNAHLGRAIGTKDELKKLNLYLDTLQNKVFEEYNLILHSGELITAERINEKLLGNTEKPTLILDVFRHHNEQIRLFLGGTYAALRYKRYCTFLGNTKDYIEW